MKIFKVERRVLLLLALVFLATVFFSAVHALQLDKHGKIIILVILNLFVLIPLLMLSTRRLTVDGDVMTLHALLVDRRIRLSALDDISVIKLRGRVVLVLSDPENFVFLSSLFEDFDEIRAVVLEHAPAEVGAKLEKLSTGFLARKRMALLAFLALASAFFFGAGIYELLD